jgi:hypothetical protein
MSSKGRLSGTRERETAKCTGKGQAPRAVRPDLLVRIDPVRTPNRTILILKEAKAVRSEENSWLRLLVYRQLPKGAVDEMAILRQ